MGELSRQLLKNERRRDLPRADNVPPQERRALATLRKEARQHHATLASGGKGGLPSSFVLGVFRRDRYQCKVCGGRKNLGLHHKGGIVGSKWLSKKGHRLDLNNVVTICEKSHDEIHNKARAEGVDSSQVKPEGDKS